MSEKTLEKIKKYGILISVYLLLTYILSFIKPQELYWKKDILGNENFINHSKIYIFISAVLIIIAIVIIYKETQKEKYKNKNDEKKAYIFTAIIASFFLVLCFTYMLNELLIGSRLLINKQFEKSTISENYKIDIFKDDFVDIKLLNGGYQRVEIDSVKFKDSKLKDSIAVIKSKIGLFKIPYDHEVLELK